MGKFAKGCLITSLVMILLGFVCVVVSVVTGGVLQTEQMIENGELSFGSMEAVSDDVLPETKEKVTVSEPIEARDFVYEGEFSAGAIAGRDVRELDIDVAGGHFIIKVSEDSQFHLRASEGKYTKVQYYLEGDTLRLTKHYSLEDYIKYDNNSKMVLSVPADCVLDEADIDFGAGVMEMDSLKVNGSMDVAVGAGELTAENISAGKLSIEVGAGEALFAESSATDMDISVGMGNVEYAGDVTGDLDAECGMGSIMMSLSGSRSEHNYQLESAMGNIELGEQSYSGLESGMYIDNQASSEFNIECGMGSIELAFEE